MCKKALTLFFAAMLIFSSTIAINAAELNDSIATTTTILNGDHVTPRKVDFEAWVDLDGGDTWKKTFDVGKLWPIDDHNAFAIDISNVEGQYKVLINGGDGYFYESKITSGDIKLETVNVSADVKYSVAIVNTKSDEIASMYVKLYSFYN